MRRQYWADFLPDGLLPGSRLLDLVFAKEEEVVKKLIAIGQSRTAYCLCLMKA